MHSCEEDFLEVLPEVSLVTEVFPEIRDLGRKSH
jgi:hypothetical protein